MSFHKHRSYYFDVFCGLTSHAIVGESLTELIHHNEKYAYRITTALRLQTHKSVQMKYLH